MQQIVTYAMYIINLSQQQLITYILKNFHQDKLLILQQALYRVEHTYFSWSLLNQIPVVLAGN